MRNFRELQIWQQSVELSVDIYSTTESFPKSETYGLASQIQRACVSIASNIAEGASRSTEPDFARFLDIAMGSSFELQTQLTIAHRIGYLSADQLESLLSRIQTTERQMNALLTKLRNRSRS